MPFQYKESLAIEYLFRLKSGYQYKHVISM